MYLRLGSDPCVVVSSAAAAKEMTKPSIDASFSNRPKGLFFGLISDDQQTLVHAPHGPYWRQLRKFSSSQLFSPQRHASYQGAREQELRNLMTVLDQQAGEVVDLKSWLFELSVNVMTRMLINKRYFGSGGASQQERDDIQELFLMVLRVLSTSAIIGDFIPSLRFVAKITGTTKKLEDLRDETLRITSKMMDLDSHRERAKERQADDDSYVPDFVDLISTAPLQEDGTQPLSDRIQTLIISELLGAGTETASTTVEWALAELVAHPHLMKQVLQELDDVVGRNNGQLMQESDVPNLPFLCAVVKETFRLHTPGPLGAPRACTQPVEAWGYQIPANSRLIMNLHAIHHDPELYPNPYEFNPGRFVDHPEVTATSGFSFFELIPFSVGRRMCPGAQLGYTMVHLMLGNLLHSYEWTLPKGTSMETFKEENLKEEYGITVHRLNPLKLVATPRNALVAPST